ncbi:hypothetical protein LTR32_002184 [Rachicladosporium monterosium]|uniref:Xylanolytic transcriptional activator regulatory domain-containing protein n=1 Tax=Rachicladosporium monterosium TaxID=1507873 RepID=A0ABR0LB02_9PEZI|nr:hypothetical protein LTR32_002184 [Rachicladosporium monterosium]
MLDYLREGDEPVEMRGKCQDLAMNFRNRLTDCLILADYLLPHEFLIEALIFHMYAEYVSSRDAKSSVWVLNGMIIRLAMRMGYHQPSQPTLISSPFKAEMRRRAWTFIRQSDIMLSFQMGLPNMIQLPIDESNLPRNILDDANFHEDCTTLPPPLPDAQATTISFLLAKTRLVFGFARAATEINRAQVLGYERIPEIDRELRDIYDNIPEDYKLGHLSRQDSLVMTSAKFSLATIHHKSLCVAHSRYLELDKSDQRYAFSSRVCLSSAMSMLRMQAIQDQPIPVDGQMRSLTSYQTSLATHDYLLAAALVSRELCSGSATVTSSQTSAGHGMPTRVEMVRALEVSARIFGSLRSENIDASKAADVLEMVVKTLKIGSNPASIRKEAQSSRPGPSSNSGYSSFPANPAPRWYPRSSAADESTSSGIGEASPSASISTNGSSNAMPAHDPQHSLRQAQHSHGEGRAQPASVPSQRLPPILQGEELDYYSLWNEPQPRATTSAGASLQTWTADADLDFVMSERWPVQQVPLDSTDAFPSLGVSNPLSSYPALAMDNPVSTLWNVNPGHQGFPGL